MDPNMSIVLANRAALESMPPDRRRRRPTATRSRTVSRLLTGIFDRALKVRWGVRGMRTEDMTAESHGRGRRSTSAKEMS